MRWTFLIGFLFLTVGCVSHFTKNDSSATSLQPLLSSHRLIIQPASRTYQEQLLLDGIPVINLMPSERKPHA